MKFFRRFPLILRDVDEPDDGLNLVRAIYNCLAITILFWAAIAWILWA